MQTQCQLDGRKYVLDFDENQLRRRGVGDLITCEITDVIPNPHQEQDQEN